MATLPRFSRGLKLSRFGIIVMLLQLALSIVMTVKAQTASDMDSALSVVKWTNYFLLANITATAMMLVGTAMSIGELARAGLDIGKMVIAAVGFAIVTGALVWMYRAFGNFVDILLDPDVTLEAIEAAPTGLEWIKPLVVIKDIAYGVGLIMVLRTVQQSAAANDQLGLRDEAGHMSRAIIVMVFGDVFYQLTYGLGGGAGGGPFGAVGALLIAIYWIWCHVKLVRFFEGAAHFVNEPHDLPVATVLKVPEMSALKPKPPTPRQSRPSMPQVPTNAPPIVVIQPPAPAPVPRAVTSDGESGGEGPKFLR